MVMEVLDLQDGCDFASLATVSREWQFIIERYNFARIHLTPSRLADFASIIHRNRALVRYIWLCLELEEYDCAQCVPGNLETLGVSNTDNTLIKTALQDLFSALSKWEPHGNNLLLDISAHSPSDSEHWFKYLTFGPDIPTDECDQSEYAEQSILVKLDDHNHGWIAGSQDYAPNHTAIEKVFDEIMAEGPLDNDEQNNNWWWQKLPLVPTVTGVLLRQQNRRRWKPATLEQMFARLPGLQELHYEPWREWFDIQQQRRDQCECCCVSSSFCAMYVFVANLPIPIFDIASRSLFESLASRQLRRLVLFENFNPQYHVSFMHLGNCHVTRIPASDVSRAVANASLQLEHLSASFMVDATYFFRAREPSWEWPNLTSLSLTSQLLSPDESPAEMDDMLRVAAAAAMKMPKPETMEIWNGEEGSAMLFRYQATNRGGQPAVITWRGRWEFALRPPVIRDWEAVALKHHCQGSVIVEELLDVGDVVMSHSDAIHHLKLSKPVMRPVSLRQIQMEQRIRERGYN